jgi:RsbT co-antagonist protein rsbRD N-terminal domain
LEKNGRVGLKRLLIQNKRSILERWGHLILETYPGDTSKFMGQEKDPFLNPVGYTIAREIETLYEGLLQGREVDQLSGHLEKIVQIRSVQDFSPSRAVLFVPLLKKAVRQEIERSGIGNQQVMEEWLEFDTRIDQLSLMAFDLYTKYRERIYDIRISEMKKERDRALKLLGLTGSTERHQDSETGSR